MRQADVIINNVFLSYTKRPVIHARSSGQFCLFDMAYRKLLSLTEPTRR